MEIWIVVLPFSSGFLSDEVYRGCLGQVDTAAQVRVQRFYHREDSWRSLVGMLLPRALLTELGIPRESITFGRTEAGKPFIKSPSISPAVGYNITHDNAIVAMASHQGDGDTVDRIGIDVMKRALPRGQTVRSFLRAIDDTLTPSELAMFTPELDTASAVRYIFLLWTLKEAYTKALGLGLGFDFKRIEYDITRSSVSVDGNPPLGWEFFFFVIQGHGQSDVYQGAVAKWVGGEQTRSELIPNVEDDPRIHFKELSQLNYYVMNNA